MSAVVTGIRILASLAGLGQQFGGTTAFDFGSGEYLAGSVTNITGDVSALLGYGAVRWNIGMGLGRSVWAEATGPEGRARKIKNIRDFENVERATDVLVWAMSIVDALGLLAGFGPPYDGDELTEGSQQFAGLSGQQMVALPDGSWKGAASQAYADLNMTLANTAQTTAELDLRLAAVIQAQADWNTHIRLVFGILKGLLAAALVAEAAMISAGNVVNAKWFAYAAAGLGVFVAGCLLTNLLGFSAKSAADADALAGEYEDQAKDPAPGAVVVQANVATGAEEFTVPSF
ncbi:hypothetical protein A5641_07315 [Mycobacterium sp. 1554424.7]|nr:hypothetical protein A5641_07315 [Mycobacterium sp. 1554424.7]